MAPKIGFLSHGALVKRGYRQTGSRTLGKTKLQVYSARTVRDKPGNHYLRFTHDGKQVALMAIDARGSALARVAPGAKGVLEMFGSPFVSGSVVRPGKQKTARTYGIDSVLIESAQITGSDGRCFDVAGVEAVASNKNIKRLGGSVYWSPEEPEGRRRSVRR